MILNCEQMRAAEERAFKRGVSANALMESAGEQIAALVMQFHSYAGLCVAYCGKGHNAGDALVACRLLREAGWEIAIRLVYPQEELAALTAQKLDVLGEVPLADPDDQPSVILDGILGIGAKGALREPVASAVTELNQLRKSSGALTVAIDLPTGLDSETGIPSQPAVEADLTAAIAFAKTCLLADTAINNVGRLAVLPLAELTGESEDPAEVATPSWLADCLVRRPFDTHKGMSGRVGIIAGSRGFPGAARLCSAAAVRGGSGLATLYVLEEDYAVLAGACHPEVMVKPVSSYREILDDHLDALAIGPGLGFAHSGDILSLIRHAPLPVVVDADALTILSKDISLLKHCAGPRLLTPHPGEMERLAPRAEKSRREWAEDFVSKYPVTLLLKGARTIIAEKNSPVVFNTTGHPGMATGGMGDVLTGICGALLAQGYSTRHTAVLGAWLCGHAAECAVNYGSQSAESLAASDLFEMLGESFTDLRQRCY
ncbi:MAG: NAD(P)H-hydrate dehydratase [Chthoniobacterales bacterium]